MTTPTKSIPFASLPAIGAELEGGIFFGITTKPDGTHCAAILLPAKPDTRLTWTKALAWAAEQDAELPSRPVASMLFANLKAQLQPGWHWTSEEDDASYAWHCNFYDGLITITHKSYEGSCVAVRSLLIT